MPGADSHRSGFSVVEGLLVVGALAALSLSGWAVYQHMKRSATTTAAAGNPNQSSSQQVPTTTTPAPTVAYLDITEWGIKLPLPAALKDAYYVPSASNVDANGVPLAMWLGLTSLKASGCDATSVNTPGQQSSPLGVLLRVAPTDVDHVSGVPFTKEYPGLTIGSYYYAYSSRTQYRTCASAATLQSVDSAFTAAIKAATAATTPSN